MIDEQIKRAASVYSKLRTGNSDDVLTLAFEDGAKMALEISVEQLKVWIAKNSELTLEGKRLSSHELLKYLNE